jgi:hypothetical protein
MISLGSACKYSSLGATFLFVFGGRQSTETAGGRGRASLLDLLSKLVSVSGCCRRCFCSCYGTARDTLCLFYIDDVRTLKELLYIIKFLLGLVGGDEPGNWEGDTCGSVTVTR